MSPFHKIDKELTCILGLSITFMLLFAADNSMVNMQKTVVSSIAEENAGFAIDGYTVTGIVYTIFAVSLWFGAYINYALGPRITLALSACGYLWYIMSYAVEDEWAIYSGSITIGIAAGCLWPAHGQYMIENSSPQTTGRNAAIFTFIYYNSNLFGNLFVYFTFYGKKYINKSTRLTAIYSLAFINAVAIFAFLFLPKSNNSSGVKEYGLTKTMKKCWSILISPKMLWLSLTFSYSGLQQAFCNGIYSPSIGFTLELGDYAKQLVPLSGIFMSFGSLIGAFCPMVFSKWIQKHSYARRLVVLVGCIVQLFAYIIVFINLPNDAVFGDTHEVGLIKPSVVLAMLGSVLLAFGDTCLITQIYSFIGDNYRESSAEACALYKFIKSILVAASFYGSGHLGLHLQLSIMAVMGVFGIIGFCVADRNYQVISDLKKPAIT